MKTLKRYVALWLSEIFAIKAKKGIITDLYLYGNIFYNKRKSVLNFEEKLYRAIPDLGGTIIEAGAHIGCYTLFLGKSKSKSKILTFEPNRKNFKFLRKNIFRNKLKNVYSVNMGLGNKNETRSFVSDIFISGTGSFREEKKKLILDSDQRHTKQDIKITKIDFWV
jgi:FkbM family methyltransferase